MGRPLEREREWGSMRKEREAHRRAVISVVYRLMEALERDDKDMHTAFMLIREAIYKRDMSFVQQGVRFVDALGYQYAEWFAIAPDCEYQLPFCILDAWLLDSEDNFKDFRRLLEFSRELREFMQEFFTEKEAETALGE